MADINLITRRNASYYESMSRLFDLAQGEEIRMKRLDGTYQVRLRGTVGEGSTLGEAVGEILSNTHPGGTAGEIVDGVFDFIEEFGPKK